MLFVTGYVDIKISTSSTSSCPPNCSHCSDISFIWTKRFLDMTDDFISVDGVFIYIPFTPTSNISANIFLNCVNVFNLRSKKNKNLIGLSVKVDVQEN